MTGESHERDIPKPIPLNAGPTYPVGMVSLDAAAQQHCPHDDVVMREIPGAYECPECGHRINVPSVPMPPEFDGPAFKGF